MAKEYITLAGLAKEFIELVDETSSRYNKGDEKEKEAIIQEIKATGADLFSFFGEELAEVMSEASKRFHETATETDEFLREMEEEYKAPAPSYAHEVPALIDLKSTSETWVKQTPVPGDHICVERLGGLYTHHGIYIGDDTVIHFAPPADIEILDWENAKVSSTSLSEFLQGGKIKVKVFSEAEKATLYPVEQIINNARSSLGSGNYHLIFNNCEHFANACTLGMYRSPQVAEFFHTVANFLD